MATSSALFEGYRSLGLVSSHIPHHVRYVVKRQKLQIITAVGRSFLVFNQKLQMVESCVAHSNNITAMASDNQYLFTGSEKEIFAWKHGHKWKLKSYQGLQDNVAFLLILGPEILAIDKSNRLYVWDIGTEELNLEMSFSTNDNNKKNIQITALMHPATYINKIVIAFSDGRLQLWNIRRQKMIHEFCGWNSKVTKICQAPALNIVAIGHENGLIALHDLKQDQTLMKFYQEWGPVVDLSFRTDEGSSKAILVSSSNNGHLALWNLDEQRLEAQMRDIHTESIVGITFISKQPLLVTNSSDNSLKMYVFDDLQAIGRVLYQREGHTLPPNKIRFYGDRGHYILSAGQDSSLRAFFIYSERKNRNLGTASYNRKVAKKKGIQRDRNRLPPIVEYAFEHVREKEWDNIVAIHQNIDFVTTWSFDKMKMGKFKLIHDRFASEPPGRIRAKCLAMTACGNFVIIGYNTGHLDRYNVQSGIYRGSYCQPEKETAHDGDVRALVTDGLDQLLISGSVKELRFWNCLKNQLIGTLTMKNSIDKMVMFRENNFVAVSMDNFDVIIIDVQSRKTVRYFGGHSAPITDMVFDNNCQKLFVSSMNCIIYVWDMVSGQLVDALRTHSPCTSLTFSPTSEFLATTHVNDRGIYLWANLSLYSVVNLKPMNVDNVVESARFMELPRILNDDEDDNEDKDKDDDEDDDDDDNENKQNNDEEDESMECDYISPATLGEQMITLSKDPLSRWKNLLNIEMIRKRNKPIEPKEKPKPAPFFLPTIAGLAPKFDIANKDEEFVDVQARRPIMSIDLMSEFVRLLDQAGDPDDLAYDELDKCFHLLLTYGNPKIDAEIQTLSRDTTGSTRYLELFLCMCEHSLKNGTNFEAVLTLLLLTFKHHLAEIKSDERLVSKVQQINDCLQPQWSRLSRDIDRSLCLMNFLRNNLAL